MSSKGKIIGTKAESAVVKAARARGFGQADRHVMKGAKDEGDVWLCPGVIIEVKGGEMARSASAGQIDRWMEEVDREIYHAEAKVGFLVTQARGIGEANAHLWRAHMRLSDWLELTESSQDDGTPWGIVSMTFDTMLRQLRVAGWGDEL